MQQLAAFVAIIVSVVLYQWIYNRLERIKKDSYLTEDEPVKEVSLTAFVEDNQKVLTSLGIFTALTVFSSTLPLKAIGYILTFLFLTASVLLFFELLSKLPQTGLRSDRLFWFAEFLWISLLALMVYWLIEFRMVLGQLAGAIILVVFLWVSIKIFMRLGWFVGLFKDEPKTHRRFRSIIAYIISLGIVLIGLYLASVLVPPINKFLDVLGAALESLQ